MGKPYSKQEEQFTPFTELCKYADEYHLVVELEKPFAEFDQIFLKILDADENEIKKITLDDISVINEVSGRLLNDLAKTKH